MLVPGSHVSLVVNKDMASYDSHEEETPVPPPRSCELGSLVTGLSSFPVSSPISPYIVGGYLVQDFRWWQRVELDDVLDTEFCWLQLKLFSTHCCTYFVANMVPWL
jgi:hypothetical protein